MNDPQPSGVDQGRADLLAWQATRHPNAFEADPFLQHLLGRHLGERFEAARDRLRAVAESAGAELDAWVRESSRDENLPTLRRYDAVGQRTEEVVFHPDYHRAGRAFWESGVLAVLATPGNEVLAGAVAYLLDQHGEAGHACPVACTAGAVKLVQRFGTPEQRDRYLPDLLSSDYDRRLHAAQFVTEVQGGSDVGRNACVAEAVSERPGWYRLRGEKWFCSVADAELFVVSARPEGGPLGTRGLGLFLVPRRVDGAPNRFTLRRLKDKLGTRSMATGEIDFDGALGEAIGPLDQGFKNLVGVVLDTSRVHNALAACGSMRRACREAGRFAEHRVAFERPILDHPAVQEILARMKVRTMAALATTFRLLALTDRLEVGGPDEALTGARRIGVMINKYWTALAGTRTVRDGIEVLGGNGTVEDLSALPRLYRDAIVIESWEGTHNTLCAQVLRDFAARGLHRPWLGLLRTEVEGLRAGPGRGWAETAGEALVDLEDRVERLLATDPTTAGAQVRAVVDRMCRLTDWVALAAQGAWEHEHGVAGDTADALELYRRLEFAPADPQDDPGRIDLHRRLARGA